MGINEETMNKLTELLKVIDFGICELNDDSITIKDQLCPVEYIDKIKLPVQDYSSYDDLRLFTGTKIDENYYFRVLNAKYPKIQFNKNGIGFDISMSKTTNDKEEEIFNLGLSYNGCYYLIFIGKNNDEKYMCCRVKEKEWLDFYYVIKPQNKKEINITFNGLFHQLVAVKDKENSSIVVRKFLKSEILNDESYLIDDNDIDKYFNAIAFKLKDIMLRVIEVISKTNENFLSIIYRDYSIVKEFIDMTNNEVTEELIDNLFEKYSNINFCTKEVKSDKRLTKQLEIK